MVGNRDYNQNTENQHNQNPSTPPHKKIIKNDFFFIGIFLSAFLLFPFLFGNFSQKLLFNKIGLLRCSGMNGQNSDLV